MRGGEGIVDGITRVPKAGIVVCRNTDIIRNACSGKS